MSIPVYKFAVREGLDKSFLPTRAHKTDTGWDVKCAEPDGIVLQPYKHVKIRLGFRAFCPEGWWYELRPRSSSFGKKHLHSLYGVIDETYENELVFACQYIPPQPFRAVFSPGKPLRIPFGERIGQIIPMRRQEMEVVDVSNEEIDKLYLERGGKRGTGGFGST